MNSNEPIPDPTARFALPSLAGAIPRLIIIAVVVGGIAALFAYAGGWFSPHTLTPARFVDTFEAGGVHPGFRRNHAKGVCVTGYFVSNGKGVPLCKAAVFEPGRVPVVGRFSFGGPNPNVADTPDATRGLGLSFALKDGEQWRTAMVNLPVFPVRTPQAFHDLLVATAPNPSTGKPDMDKIKAFAGEHPEFVAFREAMATHPPSPGFENSTFNSLNAFCFINDAGTTSWVRWSFTPVEAVAPVNTNVGGGKNQLFDSLIAKIHSHPPQWHLIITVAGPGDPTDNASQAWPSDRQQIDVGTLTIDHVESDDTGLARNINFDPLTLPGGMAPSDDPVLSARSAVYSQSFTRREGEPKQPSAISPEEAAR